MNTLLRMAAILSVAACRASPPRTMDSVDAAAAEHSVWTVEMQRFAAMTRADVAALDTLLADDLTYAHTSGQLERKREFLATLRSGRLVYDSIVPTEHRVRFYDNISVVTGGARVQVRPTGATPLRFNIRYTSVYVLRRDRWQLVAWQSTRRPEL